MTIDKVPKLENEELNLLIDKIVFAVKECDIFYNNIIEFYINIEFRTFNNLKNIYLNKILSNEIALFVNPNSLNIYTPKELSELLSYRHIEEVNGILEVMKKNEIDKSNPNENLS
jgi:hypothetical protein